MQHASVRRLSTSVRPLTIGIRREDPSRIWERRCPLTPDAVRELVRTGIDVLVQPCERRVFGMNDFFAAGARPHETLEPAHIALGIKEPPLSEVITSPLPSPASGRLVPRTQFMFSHTTKGQPYNMPLLARFLAGESLEGAASDTSRDNGALLPRVIDYELLTDAENKRTVGFGWFAGVAGALESLSAMAHAHLELGVASPFLYTPRPHTHPCLVSLRKALRDVGKQIEERGTPSCLGPCILGVTGTGKVAQGVLSILEDLPLKKICVEDLGMLVKDPSADLHKVYLLHVLPKDYLRRKDGREYDRTDYYARPEEYVSEFHLRIAPYLTLLLNGIGWAPSFPRLMTNAQLAEALELARSVGKGRFASVGDISCDVQGGLEFLTHATTLSDPFYNSSPATLPPHLKAGIQMMAVDILPATLPLDASVHFSNALRPYLHGVIRAYLEGPIPSKEEQDGSGVDAALARATVAQHGRLVGAHGWLYGEIAKGRAGAEWAAQGTENTPVSLRKERKKRVLMLGSGMVAGPAIDELCRSGEVELVVGSNVLGEAERLTAGHANATAVAVDMSEAGRDKVHGLIAQADVVISLLPVPFHPAVAEMCIEHRKHMVTASYASAAMRELHDRAAAADVLLLNEIGLDPGIDHCSAAALLQRLQREHKRVASFVSFCGGLPAPDSLAGDGTGLGYKFSWSPRGVLSAPLNGARFKLLGKLHTIEGAGVLRRKFPNVPLGGEARVLQLEGIANRDSLGYANIYGLGPPNKVRTLLRGTLRYPGFCELMRAFEMLGLLETEAGVRPDGWADLVRAALEHKLRRRVPSDRASVLSAVRDRMSMGGAEWEDAVRALDWLGVMPSDGSGQTRGLTVQLPKDGARAPVELFAAVVAEKLKYAAGERDMVILAHEVVAEPIFGAPPTGAAQEVHTSSLVAFGTPGGASAMARTVGLPVAFAAQAVLGGKVGVRGVQGPSADEGVWRVVLEGLEEAGLCVREGVGRDGMEGVLGRAMDL